MGCVRLSRLTLTRHRLTFLATFHSALPNRDNLDNKSTLDRQHSTIPPQDTKRRHNAKSTVCVLTTAKKRRTRRSRPHPTQMALPHPGAHPRTSCILGSLSRRAHTTCLTFLHKPRRCCLHRIHRRRRRRRFCRAKIVMDISGKASPRPATSRLPISPTPP
jgi:hypothetical protein